MHLGPLTCKTAFTQRLYPHEIITGIQSGHGQRVLLKHCVDQRIFNRRRCTYLDAIARIGNPLPAQALLVTTKTDIARAGMILSTGHFLVSPGHLEDVTERATATETHEKGLGYVAGRFLTDLGLTTATTATIGRVKWERGRESAVAEIFERESNPYWVRSHVGGRGPKTFPVSAHFSHRGLDLPTKDQSLVKFLTARRRMLFSCGPIFDFNLWFVKMLELLK